MRLRAAFMGSPEFAVPSLRIVTQTCDLQTVVCQPDRPAGRGRAIAMPAVKTVALELGLPILQPTKMKDGTLAAALASLDLDMIVVVAFGRILPPDILALPRHGCINVHASLLPRWRGAAPIQRAILAGDRETGVTIMQMDAGLDTGPIHDVMRLPIDPFQTQRDLFTQLADVGAQALAHFLDEFPDVPPPTAQPDDGVTLAPPLEKSEGRIDWMRSTAALVDHVRGMDPWPGAFTSRGVDELRLFHARPSIRERASLAHPGEVLAVDDQGLHVATGDGVIAIVDVQPPGKRRMPAKAYATGRPFTPNELLGRAAP
jgi:methionyl-tRNA formyltransferase